MPNIFLAGNSERVWLQKEFDYRDGDVRLPRRQVECQQVDVPSWAQRLCMPGFRGQGNLRGVVEQLRIGYPVAQARDMQMLVGPGQHMNVETLRSGIVRQQASRGCHEAFGSCRAAPDRTIMTFHPCADALQA